MARSLFHHIYLDSSRFARESGRVTSRSHSSLLHGSRDFGWPVMALRTSFALGPVRHALSQMVVAGTMSVFPPFVKVRPPPDSDASDDDQK